jgi:hypothetical protein
MRRNTKEARSARGRPYWLSSTGYWLLFVSLSLAACGKPAQSDASRVHAVYDKATGRLQQLTYDSNGNGKIDTWSYMDGTRVLRIEIDKDEDGKIDRWEYYGPDQKLEKVGFSRANDGKPDAWAYQGADGQVAKIEISTKRDGRIDRTEFYEKGALARAEEDTDGDLRVDKWETWQDGALTMVALDTSRRGTPDRRLVYGPGGALVRLEVDKKGDGRFVVVTPSPDHGPRTKDRTKDQEPRTRTKNQAPRTRTKDEGPRTKDQELISVSTRHRAP